jgi:hypothetical protein
MSEGRRVLKLGRLAGGLRKQHFGESGIWDSGILGFQESGNPRSGDPGIRGIRGVGEV